MLLCRSRWVAWPNPAVEGTACKLRLQVPSALRAPAAPHLYVRRSYAPRPYAKLIMINALMTLYKVRPPLLYSGALQSARHNGVMHPDLPRSAKRAGEPHEYLAFERLITGGLLSPAQMTPNASFERPRELRSRLRPWRGAAQLQTR